MRTPGIYLRPEKTEDLKPHEISGFFVKSRHWEIVTRIFNAYIVGHKGSGKSMVLKYLSSDLQITRFKMKEGIDFDKRAIGIFVKCDTSIFGGISEAPGDGLDQRWISHFTHTFNLCCLQLLLSGIRDFSTANLKIIPQGQLVQFLHALLDLLRVQHSDLSLDSIIAKLNDEIDSLEDEHQQGKFSELKRYYSTHQFLYKVRGLLQEKITAFREIEPVFLLDEYNALSNGQQRIINEMIKHRRPVFKMSTVPYGYITNRLDDSDQNDIDQDFDVIPLSDMALTPNSDEMKPTREFLRTICNRRFQKVAGVKKDIAQILQSPEPYKVNLKKKRNKADIRRKNESNYCGFANYVILSSGNPKTFLDLVQKTLNKAYEKKIDLRKRKIPTKIQLDSILEYSRTKREDIIHSDTEYGRPLHRLIGNIGKILVSKNTKEGNPYRTIAIRNEEILDDLARNTIELGYRKSLLIPKGFERVSRNERIRLHTLTLNNLLLPSFDLPLSSQQTWEVEATEIERIVKGEKPAEDKKEKERSEMKHSHPKVPSIDETVQYLSAIKEELKNDRLILFCGSGLSTYAGYPSADDLRLLISQKLDIANPQELPTLAEAAQGYANLVGRINLLDLIKTRFAIKTVNRDLHRKLAALGVSRIITTNWDNLIEDALREAGIQYDSIVTSLQLTLFDERRVGIFKMHGDLSSPDKIIVTSDDYLNYSETHAFMVDRIKSMLQNKGVLFIGYSLKDPNFNHIRELVIKQMQHLRSSFAIFRDVSRSERNYLESKGIKIIETDFQKLIGLLVP